MKIFPRHTSLFIRHDSSRAAARRGIASLPTILVLVVLIVAVGIGITVLSLSEVFSTASQKQSSDAYVYAEAGARDALERIARNKNYVCDAPAQPPGCYSLDFTANGCSTGAGCARVNVSAASGTAGNPKVVTSTGQAGLSARTVSVGVIFDTSQNGEIATTTWTEITN